MSQINPHFLQQRKILIDNLLHMKNQQESQQMEQPHNMNSRQPSHNLHSVSEVHNSHNAHSHHTNTIQNSANHYMIDPRHYGTHANNMSPYPPGSMTLQPVNLMGNINQMSNRQMTQQVTPNAIDLHQRIPPKSMTPTTMPQQSHVQPRNLPHQIQQMQSIENNRQVHERQQMQSHHVHAQLQHPMVQNTQVPITTSSPVNLNGQHVVIKQEQSVGNNSQNLPLPQQIVQSHSPHSNKDISDSLHEELQDGKSGEQMGTISYEDGEESQEDDRHAEKLVIEEAVSEESLDEDGVDENEENNEKKKFKCNICPKRFARKNALTNHFKLHSQSGAEVKSEGEGGGIFVCNVCPKTFVNQQHLTRHLKSHSENNVFRCNVCHFDFYVKREYNRHMKMHEGVKTFLCSVCSKTFTDKIKFNRHMRAHEGIKPFQCNVCSESFTQRSNLNIHLRIHDGIRPFQCNVCYICFTNKSDLNRHARIHNGIKPFLCSMCAKCFSRKDDLNRHMKIHEGSKRYICTLCPKIFTRKDDLNRHLRSHDGLKPFQCSVCFESFTQKALLNIHLRIHTNSKPHECSICTESFSQKSNLYIHLKLQHGVNPFKCELCPDETFEKETQLSLHMRTMHGVKPFKCSMCDENFAKKTILKEHLRSAHNVNPFKCDICFKCFTKKSNLRTHIKTHDPIPCDKCPEIFENKIDLQSHVNECHNLNVEEDDEDKFDAPKEKSFNCRKCLRVVKLPYEIKVELPFVCAACSGEEVDGNDPSLAAKSKPARRKSTGRGKSKSESLFSCQLCSKSFRYRLPLVKHCKKLHDVDLESEAEDGKSVDSGRVKKESLDTTELSGPLGNFKCALCDKVFVRKATLDRHVTVHGISGVEHDEIMGDNRAHLMTSAPDGDSLNLSLNETLPGLQEESMPEINVNKSNKDNVYIVMPKQEIEQIVKEEILSDFEDNDNSMMTSMHDDNDSDDDVPLSKRSFNASSADEEKHTPKKRGRKKGVPNRRKSGPKTKSDAETTDYDESAVETDYLDEDGEISRAEESGVDGKENDEANGGRKPKRRRRRKEDGPTEFPCPDCGKIFNRKTTLKRHVRIHIGIKEFQCWICSKCFMEKSHLTRHMRKHAGVRDNVEADAPYSCSICERKFTIKGQLSRHLRAHENDKPDTPQTCHICSKSFDKKAKFKRHMKVHDGVREHQCQVCGNRFKQKSNLNIHMKIHEGIKAHQCGVCMMKFTNKSDLNRHMRKHDGVKPFLCSICAKNFSRKDDLNRHMRKHDGIKPFLCSMCAEAFSRKDHLKKHMRKCYGPPTGEYKPRKRMRKAPPAVSEGVAAAMVAGGMGSVLTQDLSVRPEPPQYRAGMGNSVSAHAHQVLQASVGQAAASGLFWCAAQYYTNPPTIEFAPKSEFY